MPTRKQWQSAVPKIPRPNINTFIIRSDRDGSTFTAYFGDGPPIVIDGYGGWQVTARPKEIGITEWIGRNPIQIEIPFMIDNYTFNTDIADPGIETEREVRKLEKLCGIGGHTQPPICTVNGHGVIPHDEKNAPGYHKWVIESVSWDKDMEIRSGASQRRMKCGGSITIRQYITASNILPRLGPNARSRNPEIYIVKSGDTISKIAAKKYGDANKWKRIADANNLRDPRSLTIGKRLRIPR
jgi:hypothetical protein